jgi:hypothetical protein
MRASSMSQEPKSCRRIAFRVVQLRASSQQFEGYACDAGGYNFPRLESF